VLQRGALRKQKVEAARANLRRFSRTLSSASTRPFSTTGSVPRTQKTLTRAHAR